GRPRSGRGSARTWAARARSYGLDLGARGALRVGDGGHVELAGDRGGDERLAVLAELLNHSLDALGESVQALQFLLNVLDDPVLLVERWPREQEAPYRILADVLHRAASARGV